jgi:hypothetical protein
MRKREEEFVLVSAGFRERKNYWQSKPRTYEEILTAEKVAAERKKVADAKRAAEAAAEEEKFQREKEAVEQYYIRTRKKSA